MVGVCVSGFAAIATSGGGVIGFLCNPHEGDGGCFRRLVVVKSLEEREVTEENCEVDREIREELRPMSFLLHCFFVYSLFIFDKTRKPTVASYKPKLLHLIPSLFVGNHSSSSLLSCSFIHTVRSLSLISSPLTPHKGFL